MEIGEDAPVLTKRRWRQRLHAGQPFYIRLANE